MREGERSGSSTARSILAVLLFGLVVACGGGGSGGGGGGNEAGEEDDGNTGSPGDDPPSFVEISRCPADSADDIATNTRVSVTSETPLDPSTVDASSLQLSCNSAEMAGILHLDGSNIIFTPNDALPEGAQCHASLDTSIKDTNGNSVYKTDWQFTAGDTGSFDWRFSDPIEISDQQPLIRDLIANDENLILLYSVGPNLHVHVSKDGGRTFPYRNRIDVLSGDAGGIGTLEEVDAILRDGVLHLFFRVLPVNSTAEVLYARSTSENFDEFSSPAFISSPYDGLIAMSPSMALADDGSVYFAWEDICPTLELCNFDMLGIKFLVVDPSGESVVHYEQLSDSYSKNPRLANLNGQLFISWIYTVPNTDAGAPRERSIQIYNYDTGMNQIAELSKEFNQIWSQDFLSFSRDKGLLHWEQGPLGEQRYYLATLDGALQETSERGLLLDTSGKYERHCSRILLVDDDRFAWLLGAVEQESNDPEAYLPTNRAVYLSTGSNPTDFDLEIPLDFLLPTSRFPVEGKPADDFCPFAAIDSDRTVYVTWHRSFRHEGGLRHSALLASGTPERPCTP